MDYMSFMTNDAFLKLKCDSCKNCLSYFPIWISGDKKNICGRCSEGIAEDSCAQNYVYEALAQFIKFPCRYKNEGCLEHFLPKDMCYHEKQCVSQINKCPTNHFTGCRWEGPQTNSVYHCENKHSDLILKDAEIQLDLTLSYKRESLIKYRSFLLIVEEKFYSINKLMEFSIYNFKHDVEFKEFSCILKFKASNRSVIIECVVTAIENKKVVEIYLDSLRNRDNVSLVVSGKIIFEDFDKQKETVDVKIEEPLLSILNCSLCKDYALPPIYSYYSHADRTKNILCCYCKDKSFPYRNNASGSEEFHLEKLANCLYYPCKFQKNGCSFIGKPSQIKIHLDFCFHGSHKCPVHEYVECKWTGTGAEVKVHVCKTHSNMILDSSIVTETITNDQNVSKCYILKFSKNLFRLHFAQRNNSFHWAVQIIGPFYDDYMFQLEIVDDNTKRNSLITKQSCTLLKTRQELSTQKICYFNWDQVEHLIHNHQLSYKVQVYQRESLSLSNLSLEQ